MRIRQWQKLEYYNPETVLIRLRDFEQAHPLDELPYCVSSLRTNSLKTYRERRQCALFCYAISQLFKLDVRFACSEQSDTDFVGRYELPGEVHYVPIQIKELVPNEVRSDASLQTEINKLSKYADSKDLVIAFHLNRDERIDFSEIDFSAAQVKQLWFFGATVQSKGNWLLIGDLLSNDTQHFEFQYPST